MSCMRMDIANFLRSHGTRTIVGFEDDEGKEMTDGVVRTMLQSELEQGHKFLSLCGHDNFDHETGWCRGPKQ
jgi:hypothetical protein